MNPTPRPTVSRRAFLQRSAAAVALPSLGLTAAGASTTNSEAKQRPNVVLVIADQCRWDMLGAYGLNPTGLTPNLDAVAQRGVLFRSAITNQPVCGPSRACLMTGQYPATNGVWHNGLGIDPHTPTLATAFRQAGYSANYIGKWHLAPHTNQATAGPVPRDRRGGFLDFWEGSNVLELTSHPYEGDLYDTHGQPIHYSGIYRVNFMTDRAVRFLREFARPPFLLVVSYLEPHFQNDMNRFVGPKGSAQRYANRFVPHDLRFFPGDWQSQLPDYDGCVASVDEAVGTILHTLDETGQGDNTIFAFISDHGCHFRTRNSEYKRSPHESSIHIPLVMQGPGLNRALAIPELVSMVDVTPTLLDAAGVPMPATMQGRSAVPLLDRKTEGWPGEIYFEMHEALIGCALRTDQWTYAVRSVANPPRWKTPWVDHFIEYQMYDLYSDPHQLVNLAGRREYRREAAKLRRRLIERMVAAGRPRAKIDPVPFYP